MPTGVFDSSAYILWRIRGFCVIVIGSQQVPLVRVTGSQSPRACFQKRRKTWRINELGTGSVLRRGRISFLVTQKCTRRQSPRTSHHLSPLRRYQRSYWCINNFLDVRVPPQYIPLCENHYWYRYFTPTLCDRVNAVRVFCVGVIPGCVLRFQKTRILASHCAGIFFFSLPWLFFWIKEKKGRRIIRERLKEKKECEKSFDETDLDFKNKANSSWVLMFKFINSINWWNNIANFECFESQFLSEEITVDVRSLMLW